MFYTVTSQIVAVSFVCNTVKTIIIIQYSCYYNTSVHLNLELIQLHMIYTSNKMKDNYIFIIL